MGTGVETILSLDTSSAYGSVSLRCGEYVHSRDIGIGVQASEVLLDIVDELLTKVGVTLGDCTKIICGVGPGAFTGVRLALSVTKTFAYVHKIPCVGVSSLLNLAYQSWVNNPQATCYDALLDARMQEYYYAPYRFYRNKQGILCAEEVKPPILCAQGDYAQEKGAMRCSDIAPADMVTQPSAKAALDYVQAFSPPLTKALDLLPLYVRNKVALTLEERSGA